jgi:hypothetical protein
MAGWNGTEWTSYDITSTDDLIALATQVNAGNTFSGITFTQTADLDLGGVQDENGVWGGTQWTIIGNKSKPFSGTYDGNGHVISNIYYNNPAKEYVGLFGGIKGATLKNITLASGFVYGYQYAGGICGYSTGSSKIECCTNIATVYGKMERNGGVVAYIENNVEVTDCINFGLISAFNFSGGVIGFNSKGNEAKVTNCINVGQVFCMRNTAGNLYGYDKGFTGTTLNCYYDNQINTSLGRTSTPNIIETNTDEGGVIEGKATSDMIGNGLKTLLGETNWVFDDGMYPRLRTSAQKDAVIVAATPIIIDNSDKADNITSGFSVSKITGVTWTSGNTDNLVINEDGTTTIKRSTAIVLTATKGGYTKNVYIKTNKAGATSIGSSESPLTIESEQDLIDLRNAVNTYGLYKGCANYDGFKGIHFKQTVNIALANWTEPISAHNSFKGHYDGNNNEIGGININQGTLAIVGGLFGCASHGSISNLSITSGSIIGLKDVGGICGATFCETITNCTVSKECTVSAGTEEFTDANIEVGGIVGVDKGFSSIEDCYNYSNVTSYRYSGGIIGRCNQEFVATRCKNYGEIETKSSNAGGICGNVINKDDKFDYCENHGTIKATSSTIGGIIGSQDTDVANCLISNCINSGTITGGTNGGIIGQNGGTITIENCLNLGSVSGGNGIGGGSNATISNCFNAGAATNGIASGGTIENCINIGNTTTKAIATSSTNSFYDNKMCLVTGGTAKLTSEMIGNELQNNLGTEDWTFTSGMYPMIKTLANTDYMFVASTPISLASSETVGGISTAFTYETSNSLEWSCNKHSFVSFINGTAYPANPNEAAEDVVVTVSKGKASKKIGMKINQSEGTATAIDNWPETLAPIEYNTPITRAMLTATEQNGYDIQGKGVIRYSVEENQILHAGTHYITATFIPNETSGLMPSTKTATLEVTKKPATLEWHPEDETYTYGASDNNSKIESAVAKVDGVTIDGTFTYHIPALEAGNRTIEITSFESTNYKLSDTENLTRTIYVNKADASMSWNLAPIDYGTAISDIQLGGFSSYGTISYEYEKDGSVVTKGVILPAGSYDIVASLVLADKYKDNYKDASIKQTLVVNKIDPTITWEWANPTNITYGENLNGKLIAEAKDLSGVDLSGDFVYMANDNIVTNTTLLDASDTPITINATFTPNGNDNEAKNYNVKTVSVEINVAKAQQEITWNPVATIEYGTAISDEQLNAVSSSGVIPTYTYSGGDPTDKILDANNYEIFAHFAETNNYLANNAEHRTITITPAPLTINWTPQDITYGASAEEITEKVKNAIVSYNDQEFTEADGDFIYTLPSPLNAGENQTVKIKFRPNSSNFSDVEETKTINVAKATPEIVWEDQQHLTYGASDEEIKAALENASAKFGNTTVTGDFDYTLPATNDLQAEADNITAEVTFNPSGDDANNFEPANATINIVVDKADPTITWEIADEDKTFTYGTGLSDKQLNAETNGVGEIVYTDDDEDETVLAIEAVLDAGTHTITATLPASSNYNEATATATIIVNQAETSIEWETPAPIAANTPISAAELNATANVDGNFAYTLNGEDAEGQTLGVGNYTITATFTPNSANYKGSTATITLQVVQAAAEITWATPEAITYGTAISSVQLNATSEIDGTFYYKPDDGAILPAGDTSISVIFVPDSPDYGRALDTVKLTVNKAELSVSVADITVKKGDAIPEFVISYDGFVNNENESVLTTAPTATCATTTDEVGEFEIVVSGGESDNYNITYTNGKLIVVEDVIPETPVITWADTAITYGTLINASILNAKANVEGSFTYSVNVGDTLKAGVHELIATFTPASSAEAVTSTIKLTVNKAKLSVSVADATVNQGDNMPQFKIDYNGFVLDENISDLTTIPSAKSNATTDNAGTFDIVISGGEAENYDFEYNNGKLTVNAKEDTTAISGTEVKISVYPNPTADVFFVETDSNADIIYIYNMTGKLVATEANVGKTRIDLANEPQGTYFVKVGKKTIKVLKF